MLPIASRGAAYLDSPAALRVRLAKEVAQLVNANESHKVVVERLEHFADDLLLRGPALQPPHHVQELRERDLAVAVQVELGKVLAYLLVRDSLAEAAENLRGDSCAKRSKLKDAGH